MPEKFDPADVDEFVGGVAPDASASNKTAKFVEEYKKDPNHRLEAEDAERILAALGMNACEYGMGDAKSLLEHWHACIAQLGNAGSDGTNGTACGNDDARTGSSLTRETSE
jgi:hypothetical protein